MGIPRRLPGREQPSSAPQAPGIEPRYDEAASVRENASGLAQSPVRTSRQIEAVKEYDHVEGVIFKGQIAGVDNGCVRRVHRQAQVDVRIGDPGDKSALNRQRVQYPFIRAGTKQQRPRAKTVIEHLTQNLHLRALERMPDFRREKRASAARKFCIVGLFEPNRAHAGTLRSCPSGYHAPQTSGRRPHTGGPMLEIHTIPAFSDNYFWLFHAAGDRQAWVVDPGDAAPVERALEAHELELAGIVITHHHSDHTGGVSQLAAAHGARVVGPASERIPQVVEQVREGDRVKVAGAYFEVIEVPGHTLDHIAYHCAEEAVLFCGDTLFAGGCGRVFEGTAAQMQASLAKLAGLPDSTRIFCAHEYTLANLSFARLVEPDNAALAAREEAARALRAEGTPTVPSRLELERMTNPFLRWTAPGVLAAAERRCGSPVSDPAAVFAEIRGWKDNA